MDKARILETVWGVEFKVGGGWGNIGVGRVVARVVVAAIGWSTYINPHVIGETPPEPFHP